MAQIEVTRTYVQMERASQLRPARSDDARVRIERALECTASFYRYLYREVGARYRWRDRAGWSDETIRAHLATPAVAVWVMSVGGTPAGYFELQRHDDGATEIVHFGLLPEFVGRGLGKHMLTVAAEQAWEGSHRVWLHTCTLDDRAALPNYLKRGFVPYREERYTVSDDPPT
ncbi:MAG: GNAT family N-acetyltransferase [Gemmatimonadaceae bacterium]